MNNYSNIYIDMTYIHTYEEKVILANILNSLNDKDLIKSIIHIIKTHLVLHVYYFLFTFKRI